MTTRPVDSLLWSFLTWQLPENGYFCRSLQAGLSRFRFCGKEESPDSTEQCTDEESAGWKQLRDSATENNCLLPFLLGEGRGEVENVR